ncbi:hypothetical protein E2320_014199, partial [Naja naja]
PDPLQLHPTSGCVKLTSPQPWRWGGGVTGHLAGTKMLLPNRVASVGNSFRLLFLIPALFSFPPNLSLSEATLTQENLEEILATNVCHKSPKLQDGVKSMSCRTEQPPTHGSSARAQVCVGPTDTSVSQRHQRGSTGNCVSWAVRDSPQDGIGGK